MPSVMVDNPMDSKHRCGVLDKPHGGAPGLPVPGYHKVQGPSVARLGPKVALVFLYVQAKQPDFLIHPDH